MWRIAFFIFLYACQPGILQRTTKNRKGRRNNVFPFQKSVQQIHAQAIAAMTPGGSYAPAKQQASIPVKEKYVTGSGGPELFGFAPLGIGKHGYPENVLGLVPKIRLCPTGGHFLGLKKKDINGCPVGMPAKKARQRVQTCLRAWTTWMGQHY